MQEACSIHLDFGTTGKNGASPETLMNILDIHTQSAKLVTCRSCVSHLIRDAAAGGVSACPRSGRADSVG